MADSADERKIRAFINQRLVETGEKERLKELLRSKLVECGWRDEMRNFTKELIKQKGVDNVAFEDIIAELTQHGRAQVPANIKQELLQKIRKFLSTTRRNPAEQTVKVEGNL